MQMEALFPLPLADTGAGAAVLKQQSRNSGSPQSKGTTAESEKVNDKTRGFSSYAALSSMRRTYCTSHGRIAERSGTSLARLSWEAYCVEAVKYSLSNSLAGFHAACL